MNIKIFLICVIVFYFTGNASAKSIIVIGQSNAWGIVQYGGLGKKTNTNIIDCTHPGQFISPFLPGGDFFSDCMKKSKGRDIDTVVFWQGESDASEQLTAETWKAKALILLRTLRTRVCNDTTKLVVVALHDERYEIPNTNPYWLYVRSMQNSLKGAYHIDSSNYPFNNDFHDNHNYFVHLTHDGYQMISKDIAEIVRR